MATDYYKKNKKAERKRKALWYQINKKRLKNKRLWYQINKKRLKNKRKVYYKENREVILKKMKECYQNKIKSNQDE